MMIDKVHSAMLDNQKITIRELSDELGLSFGSIQSILTKNMGMKCVSVKFAPKVLIVKQKETRLAVARDWLHCADQDTNFMKTLITGDKSWVYGYDPETKAEAKNGTPSLEQGESDIDSCLQSQRCWSL
jgi:hypothetical protein